MLFSCHLMAAPTEKLQALVLADSMMTIFGERWLIGHINLPGMKEPIPADRSALPGDGFLSHLHKSIYTRLHAQVWSIFMCVDFIGRS